MENDICACTKERSEHAAPLATGACLSFALDRKATYRADKEREKLARIHRRIDRARPFGRETAIGGFTLTEFVLVAGLSALLCALAAVFARDYRACSARGGLLAQGASMSGWVCVAAAAR